VSDLRIGAAILREALQTAGKEEDEGLKVRMAKAEEEIRIKRVRPLSLRYKKKQTLMIQSCFQAKEAFLEDRKAQALRTERERKIRSQEGMAQARSPSPIPGGYADEPEVDFVP